MPRPRRVARLKPSNSEAARSRSGWMAPAMGISSWGRCTPVFRTLNLNKRSGTEPMSSLLAGKIAVVTGASSGIGRAIAIMFASEGARLVIADVTEEPVEGGERTVELIIRAGGTASFHKADVGRWEEVDDLIGATVERHGRLDVIV